MAASFANLGEAFFYVGPGDDVWTSNFETSAYKNSVGEEFLVRDLDGVYTDNYNSCLFDWHIQEEINENLKIDVKVFLNSKGMFSGKSRIFKTSGEYMKECTVFNAAVYTTKNNSYEDIAKEMLYAQMVQIFLSLYIT